MSFLGTLTLSLPRELETLGMGETPQPQLILHLYNNKIVQVSSGSDPSRPPIEFPAPNISMGEALIQLGLDISHPRGLSITFIHTQVTPARRQYGINPYSKGIQTSILVVQIR